MLIAKGVVDTLAVDPHVLHQILDRRSLVTARPENLHGFVEDFIPIELFLARHSSVSIILYTLSGTNSQESSGATHVLGQLETVLLGIIDDCFVCVTTFFRPIDHFKANRCF
jgi:hypothetical protein